MCAVSPLSPPNLGNTVGVAALRAGLLAPRTRGGGMIPLVTKQAERDWINTGAWFLELHANETGTL
jgi:hypothetical protein